MAAYYRPFRGRVSSHVMGMAVLCSASILLGIAVLWILCATATAARAERLSMRVYTSADGLASGFINHVMRDSHGFIWFCTRDGLSRFDGYRFTNYRLGDGLGSQNFRFIFESHQGIYWIVLNGKGLYRYDPAAVSSTPSQIASSSADGRVLLNAELVSPLTFGGMAEDHAGHFWAVEAGLFLIEEKDGRTSFREIKLDLPEDWRQFFSLQAITVGEDDSVWLGTKYGLIRRLPDGRLMQYTLSQNPQSDYIRSILADKSGNIWATHPAGLYVLKPEPLSSLGTWNGIKPRRLTARRPVEGAEMPNNPGEAVDLTALAAFGGEANQISEIFQQSNGQIWLTAHNRLVLFDGSSISLLFRRKTPLRSLDGG